MGKQFKVSDVIDKGGMSPLVWLVLILVGVGMIMNGFSNMVVTYSMSSIAGDWALDPVATGSLSSWAAIGLLIGSVFGGTISDKIGRRKTMFIAMLIFSIFTALIFFVQDFAAFAALRVLAGLGLGAYFPIIGVTMAEFSPTKFRALMTALCGAFQTFGWVFAGTICREFIPAFGWHSSFLVALIGVVWALILLAALPESPFYLMRAGRKADALKVVERIAKSSSKISDGDFEFVEENLIDPPAPTKKVGVGTLFTKKYIRTTIGFWILYFCATFVIYGVNPWLPTLLQGKGFTLIGAASYSIASNAVGIISNFIVGYLLEKLGRRYGMAVGFIASFVGVALVGLVQGGDAVLFASVMFMSLCINFSPASVVASCSEAYPTQVRNTGVGWMQALSRIAQILSPLFVGALVAAGLEFGQIFLAFAVVPIIAAIALFVFIKRETRGQTLDDADAIAAE